MRDDKSARRSAASRSHASRLGDMTNGTTHLFARLAQIEYVSIDSLRASKRNPRRHPERQLVQLAAAIGEFGFVVPVLITDDYEIIAGEARVAAARRVSLAELPAIRASHLSDAQVRAFRLADNRLPELATTDLDALAIELEEIIALDEVPVEVMGWNTAEIDIILEGPEAPDPADRVIDPPAQPVTREGDLWQLGRHKLLCDSSLNSDAWTRLLDGQIARMAFTDPPYNVSVDGHVSGLGKVKHEEFAFASGEMSRAEFTEFLSATMGLMSKHLIDGAILDLCMDWRHHGELLTAIDVCELSLINLCVWNKTNAGMGSLYRSKHELVLIAKKGKASHVNNVELGKYGRSRTNVWDCAGVNGFGRGRMKDLADHPTVKPIALVAEAIRDVTRRGDIVLDAFMGSGTTLLAAERTGRVGYGIEIAPKFVDVAIRRWEAMTGSQALLTADGRTFDAVATERLITEPVADPA